MLQSAFQKSSLIIRASRNICSTRRCLGIFDFISGKGKDAAKPAPVDETGKLIPDQSEFDETYSEPADLPINLPIMTSRDLKTLKWANHQSARQAWIDTLKCREDVKLGLIDLHPDVFAANPRVDLIYKNLRWQARYRVVDWRCTTTRGELSYRSAQKPWQQKGLGKARHGTRRSPIFIGGGQSHGPRGPQSYYYLLPQHQRVAGFLSMLSIKLAQCQLHVVDSLHMPSGDPAYLEDVVEHRRWGPAVLFVNHEDSVPRNIATATQDIDHFNLMPYYGLNVWSMVKHDSVVLTLPALEIIEERLLRQLKLTNQNSLKPLSWNTPARTHFTDFHTDDQKYLKFQ